MDAVQEGPLHYIAMAGFHGCLPYEVVVFHSRGEAARYLQMLFVDDDRFSFDELVNMGSCDIEYGYAELQTCACKKPQEHVGESNYNF